MDGYKWHHFSFEFPLLSLYILRIWTVSETLIPLKHLLRPAAEEAYLSAAFTVHCVILLNLCLAALIPDPIPSKSHRNS